MFFQIIREAHLLVFLSGPHAEKALLAFLPFARANEAASSLAVLCPPEPEKSSLLELFEVINCNLLK